MVVNIGKNQFKSFLLHKVSILALSVIAARCQLPREGELFNSAAIELSLRESWRECA